MKKLMMTTSILTFLLSMTGCESDAEKKVREEAEMDAVAKVCNKYSGEARKNCYIEAYGCAADASLC
jgi:hypothetical protein